MSDRREGSHKAKTTTTTPHSTHQYSIELGNQALAGGRCRALGYPTSRHYWSETRVYYVWRAILSAQSWNPFRLSGGLRHCLLLVTVLRKVWWPSSLATTRLSLSQDGEMTKFPIRHSCRNPAQPRHSPTHGNILVTWMDGYHTIPTLDGVPY